jgi:hypothetical protein
MLEASPGTLVYKDLLNCTHVFLRQYSTRRAFEPPYSGPTSEKLHAKTPCERQTHHRVCRQCQACLHIQRGRLQTHYLQTCDSPNPSHSTFWHTTTAFNDQDYTLRTLCSFSRTLHLLNINLRGTPHKALVFWSIFRYLSSVRQSMTYWTSIHAKTVSPS